MHSEWLTPSNFLVTVLYACTPAANSAARTGLGMVCLLANFDCKGPAEP